MSLHSFAIVMYELLARKMPYSGLSAVQAALGVVNTGLRPPLPADVSPALATLVAQVCARRESKLSLHHAQVSAFL